MAYTPIFLFNITCMEYLYLYLKFESKLVNTHNIFHKTVCFTTVRLITTYYI